MRLTKTATRRRGSLVLISIPKAMPAALKARLKRLKIAAKDAHKRGVLEADNSAFHAYSDIILTWMGR